MSWFGQYLGDSSEHLSTACGPALLTNVLTLTEPRQVEETDTLPTLICLTCVDRLMFAYQFKQQCVASNDTLKECLSELNASTAAIGTTNTAGSEMITIKQENGVYLQYELPVEHAGGVRSVLTSAPPKRARGRPRKYPNQRGEIAVSPYQRKGVVKKVEEQSLSAILASGGITFKEEPSGELSFLDDGGAADNDDLDPDFDPNNATADDGVIKPAPQVIKRKRGRPVKRVEGEPAEDVLLKETIMAYSEPLPESLLAPKQKDRKKHPTKKKYNYEKTHTCETCGNSFRSNASLQAHIRRHLGIKPFVCSVCGYSCVLNMELRRHMMRHTGVRPYKCRICDRRFGDFGSRQKHERLHLGERPYQCSLCGKSFTYSYVLSNHMLTHTGEKKYQCQPCNKKFTKAHHLKYHNKVHHKELYHQLQLEQEAKKLREQIKISDFSSVLAGQILEGHNVQLLQAGDDSGLDGAGGDMELQVVEGERADDTDEAGDMSSVHYTAYVQDDDREQEMDMQIDGMDVVGDSGEEGEMIVGDLHPDDQ